ncbi:MAG: alkaline phosphatase D family protein, partial [Opitutales bacterium]|nr:alkaline phosphatase D family protein [Opitutales bacterium]
IRAEPLKQDVVLGSFNCMHWTGYPYAGSVAQMQKIKPDILAFTGDQLYEGAGGYGIVTSPLEESRLNYFHHWFLHGLAFRDLLANTASMTINDDHDVFHGNVWGESGKAADMSKKGAAAAQDTGGYKMPPQFVNLVQQGQCGHLPPSPDTSPVKQGIETYYTDVRYAGVSFAVLEDRKWKSAPANIHTDTEVYNGYFKDPAYAKDTAHIRKVSANADLLGKRQETFLEQWAADWSEGTWMKCAVSQTVFATAATDGLNNDEPWDRYSDANFPTPGSWPANATNPSHDMDSNGWPQEARDRAVHLLRKAFAPHVAGDQHLGSAIRYGIDEHDSGSVAFCVPAASTGWSRLWMPNEPGAIEEDFIGNLDGADFAFDPRNYTGKFHDGQGNRFTMLATANPYKQNERNPTWFHDRNPGYGIVTFHRKSHDITMTAWPSYAGPGGSGEEGCPYPGWPITIQQSDNYDRSAQGYLPEVSLIESPVVQVINDSTGEIEYTIRPAGGSFRPRVFDNSATYTLRTGNPDTGSWNIREGLKAETP